MQSLCACAGGSANQVCTNVCRRASLYLYAKRTGDVEEALLWLEQRHQWYVALTERRKEEEAARTRDDGGDCKVGPRA